MACSKIAYSLLVPETQRDKERERENESVCMVHPLYLKP